MKSGLCWRFGGARCGVWGVLSLSPHHAEEVPVPELQKPDCQGLYQDPPPHDLGWVEKMFLERRSKGISCEMGRRIIYSEMEYFLRDGQREYFFCDNLRQYFLWEWDFLWDGKREYFLWDSLREYSSMRWAGGISLVRWSKCFLWDVKISFMSWLEYQYLHGWNNLCGMVGTSTSGWNMYCGREEISRFCKSGRISTWLVCKKYCIYGQTEQEYLLKIVLEIFLVVWLEYQEIGRNTYIVRWLK